MFLLHIIDAEPGNLSERSRRSSLQPIPRMMLNSVIRSWGITTLLRLSYEERKEKQGNPILYTQMSLMLSLVQFIAEEPS